MKLECQRGTALFPYGVVVIDPDFGTNNGPSYDEVCNWCNNQFGYAYETNRYRIFVNNWFFKHEADRTFFIMRWS